MIVSITANGAKKDRRIRGRCPCLFLPNLLLFSLPEPLGTIAVNSCSERKGSTPPMHP